jgi:hypothetical protein
VQTDSSRFRTGTTFWCHGTEQLKVLTRKSEKGVSSAGHNKTEGARISSKSNVLS